MFYFISKFQNLILAGVIVFMLYLVINRQQNTINELKSKLNNKDTELQACEVSKRLSELYMTIPDANTTLIKVKKEDKTNEKDINIPTTFDFSKLQ